MARLAHTFKHNLLGHSISFFLTVMITRTLLSTPSNAFAIRTISATTSDNIAIAARAHPASTTAPAPAVLLAHGHLSDSRLMERALLTDLQRLGTTVVTMDRRGYGRSGGTWWKAASHTGFEPVRMGADDILAVVSELRNAGMGIDPERIAIVGHSDGANAAIRAAALDWTIAGTVALSASIAPSYLVNHAAPRNLLLLYGTEDNFILDRTDETLIHRATRGYLRGAGSFGSLEDGSARELRRIGQSGHVGLLVDNRARAATLSWIARVVDRPFDGTVAPTRIWIGVGGILLLAAQIAWGVRRTETKTFDDCAKSWFGPAAFAALTLAGGTAAGGFVADQLPFEVPTQQGSIVLVLCAILATAGGPATAWFVSRRGRGSHVSVLGDRKRFREVAGGVGLAIMLLIGSHLMLLPFRDAPLEWRRFLVFSVVAAASFPGLLGLCMAVRPLRRAPLPEMGLALAVAAGVSAGFERMAVLPGYFLAASIALAGAHRSGGWSSGATGTAVFGTIVFAHCIAMAAAWH